MVWQLPLETGTSMAGSAEATRFAALTGPSLAAYMFGASGLDGEAVRQSRLFNRLQRHSGLTWARQAAKAGIEIVCLKGLSTALRYYDDADARPMADADFLVRADDLAALIEAFRAGGLVQRPAHSRSAWGFVGDASFQPLVSPDGTANIDLHIHPDAWPLHRGLSTARVFAAAGIIDSDQGPIRVPSPTHTLVLAASHAARDLFGPAGLKPLVDTVLLLRREPDTLDWHEVRAIAQLAGLRPAFAAFFALAQRIAPEPLAIPADLIAPPPPRAGREYQRAETELMRLYPMTAGPWQRLRREALLAGGPRIAVHRNWRRISGLVRPRSGALPGLAAKG